MNTPLVLDPGIIGFAGAVGTFGGLAYALYRGRKADKRAEKAEKRAAEAEERLETKEELQELADQLQELVKATEELSAMLVNPFLHEDAELQALDFAKELVVFQHFEQEVPTVALEPFHYLVRDRSSDEISFNSVAINDADEALSCLRDGRRPNSNSYIKQASNHVRYDPISCLSLPFEWVHSLLSELKEYEELLEQFQPDLIKEYTELLEEVTVNYYDKLFAGVDGLPIDVNNHNSTKEVASYFFEKFTYYEGIKQHSARLEQMAEEIDQTRANIRVASIPE